MKKIIAVLFALILMPVYSFAGSYETLASKLVDAGTGLKGQKVVIIPFKTGSGLPDFAGAAAAHRLNVKLTQALFYDVATAREFSMADAWVAENGNPEKNTALQLMERLNAQLAITGEVKRKNDTSVEIKVKLIKPSEKKTIASVSEEIPNEWQSVGSNVPSGSPAAIETSSNTQPVPQQTVSAVTPMETYSQPSSNYSRDFGRTASNDYMFFDIFYGMMNNTEMNMEFKNDAHYVNASNFTNGSITGSYPKFELKWAETDGKGPIGLRVGFFADMLGFDFGLRYHSYETKKQSVKTNIVSQNHYDMPAKYAKMSIYEMNGDLLLRFIKSSLADAYIGFGLGMSIMNLELPYVRDSSNKPTDEIELGMSFRIPLGARWKVTDSMHLVTEVSYEASTNMTEFSRGYASEKDSFLFSGTQAIAGISFVF